MRGAWLILCAAFLVSACGNPSAPAGRNANEPDEVNLDLWLERLEVGSRELYSSRMAVVDALGLQEGDIVADIGAGTGLYSLLFAERVGPGGHVFAIDIEPLFLDLINRRAEDGSVSNISALLGRNDSITLPPQSLDVVFIADTYHYFSDRKALMMSVNAALKPGGKLYIVDYELLPGAENAPERDHVAFGKAGVISEVQSLGFSSLGASDIDGLSENYFIAFTKP